MGYNDLSECTLTADERVAEKDRICQRLDRYVSSDQFSIPEFKFIEQISDSSSVSVKQLFWLRDINEKY